MAAKAAIGLKGLTCFYCSLHCMLSCYCFDPSVDLLHAYIRVVIILHLLIECHTCYMYCTEASAPLVLDSVCYTMFCGARWKVSSETCKSGRNRYYLGCELAKFRCKAWF